MAAALPILPMMRTAAAGKRVLERGLATVSFAQFGQPSAVLKSAASAAVAPSSGEVAVKIAAGHVTGEDVRAVRGLSLLRTKTGVAGSSAVGTVATVGSGVAGVSANDKVIVVSSRGVWADTVTVPSSAVAKLPATLTDDEAAALPALLSAYAILTRFEALKAGDVVVQSDAEGPVGAAVAAVGKALGVTVVAASKGDLEGSGLAAKAKGAKLAVGSATTAGAARGLLAALGGRGTLVLYQATGADTAEALEPLKVLPGSAISGFNFPAWAAADPAALQAAVKAVGELVAAKKVAAGKVASFAQGDVAKAMAAAETGAQVALKW